MPDDLTNDPGRDAPDGTGERPGKALLVRLRDAFPVAWKHDELFRYALILSILAWLVVLYHVGGGTPRYR